MSEDNGIEAELEELVNEGFELLKELQKAVTSAKEGASSTKKKTKPEDDFNILIFADTYQDWYSTALRVVEQLLPDRYEEFQHYYRNEKRKQLIWSTYTISDYLRSNTPQAVLSPEFRAYMALSTQVSIVGSAKKRLRSRLGDIKGVLQAELFDNELDAASDLAKKRHLRAGGAVAGVVLERHLVKVAADHKITIRKAHPTISDLNDPLKNAGVYDVPTWRRVQHLADIRNICDHFKGREPSADEVEELIRGVEWVVKNIF
jgi:hypothetical protein